MSRDVCTESSPADPYEAVSAQYWSVHNCVSLPTKHKAKNKSINQLTVEWLHKSPAALTRVTRVTRSLREETLFGARVFALGA